jgi:type I restriction enzyme S subunit
MDGLECREVLLSTVRNSSNAIRIDSHYFKKQYLMLKEELLSLPHWFLKDVVSKPIQTGHTPSMANSNFYGGEIALIKTDNLHENNIGQIFSDYLTKEGNDQIARTALRENDIITTIIGATEEVIARSALVLSEYLPANINQNIVRIRVDQTVAYPEYINAYLNSKFGRQYLRYLSRQTEQVNLNCEEVGLTVVPKFSDMIQEAIKNCTVLAHKSQTEAKQCYTEAELLLTDALDMPYFTASKQSFSFKTLSESYDLSGRLDAEYYQPKYDELFASLSKQETQPLGGKNGIATIKKSIEPGSEAYCDEGIPFIRVSDITKFGITDPEIKLSRDVVPNITVLFPRRDTILFSKDGSVGIAYKVECNLNAVTSGALLHLTVKDPGKILPDYLTLVLNSKVVQMQAERDSNGAIIQHWKPSEIEKVVIPVLDIGIQKQIAAKVQESFALRHQSDQLLENAKRAVEIAIEQGEDKAIEWLKEKGVEG